MSSCAGASEAPASDALPTHTRAALAVAAERDGRVPASAPVALPAAAPAVTPPAVSAQVAAAPAVRAPGATAQAVTAQALSAPAATAPATAAPVGTAPVGTAPAAAAPGAAAPVGTAPAAAAPVVPAQAAAAPAASAQAVAIPATALRAEAAPEPSPPSATAPLVRAEAQPPAPLSGFVSLRHRARWTNRDEDHDLYLLVGADWEDPRHPEFSAHFLGRAVSDLDGSSGTFQSLSDTYDSDLEAKVYHLYAEFDPEGLPMTARIGRQYDYLTPEIAHFDGLWLRSRPLGEVELQAGLYGGVPVHLYESSASGDQILGAFVEARPWKGGRARLDWMHLEDEVLLGEFENDLVGLSLWQRLDERFSAEGHFTRLEDRDRDLRLRAGYASADGEFSARLTYYELLETQRSRALEFDPFSAALLDYHPYRQAGLLLTRALGANLGLDLGFDLRRVDDDGDVGEFNRDWERYWAALTAHDLLHEGLEATLSGDLWDGEQRDTTAVGLDLTQQAGPALRLSLGSYYSLYKYDLQLVSEREDVRTYYGRARWKRSESLSLDLLYEFEDDDYDQYHLVRWGAQWRF